MCIRRRTTLYGILWDSMGVDGKSTSLSGTKRDFSAKNRRKPVRLWFYCAISLQKLENRGFFQQKLREPAFIFEMGQTVCKPGSVLTPKGGGDHSSGMPVTRHLVQPTRATIRKQIMCCSYLVLLPTGFTLPLPLPAARCALTAPFHPYR